MGRERGRERMSARATARETHRKRHRERGGERERTRQGERQNSSARGSPRGQQGPRARAWAHARMHLGRGGGRISYCLAVYGVHDSEAAPAGLGQHACRRPISRMGAGERTPIQAGEGALTVHVILVPRTLVADPASPGESAVPMLLVVVIRASCCRNTRPCSCARLPLDISSSLENAFFSMNTQLQFHRAT